MPEQRLLLVRHGRSAHVQTGLLDRDGFLRWREAYENAGIVPGDVPPPAVSGCVDGDAIVLASDTLRAVESARVLAPQHQIETSPLYRELDLHPPRVPFRMPLALWALAYGVRFLSLRLRSLPFHGEHELQRVRAAADELTRRSESGRQVVLVTHGSFRAELTRTLMARGWTPPEGRTSKHWSAWELTRGA